MKSRESKHSKLVFARDTACKNEERLLKDLTGTEVTLTQVIPGTYFACLFAESNEGEFYQAMNNGYKIIIKEFSVTHPVETPTATQFILLNPSDSTAGTPTIITLEARDANHNVDENFTSAATLNCDGAQSCTFATGARGYFTPNILHKLRGIENESLPETEFCRHQNQPFKGEMQ